MKPSQLGVKIIRIVLGVILLVFGLNHFFQFMPMPEPPEAAMNFMNRYEFYESANEFRLCLGIIRHC